MSGLSDAQFTKVVPCIFALLPNKSQETYTRMFRCIKDQIPNFKPQYLKVDFETAAINAMKDIYPSAQISGCFFSLFPGNLQKWGKVWNIRQP